MPVNSTHPEYDAALPVWVRARDVLSGEDSVKLAGGKYLPRLREHSDEDYDAWWNSTEAQPDDVNEDAVVMELNTDYSMKGMSAHELVSVVSAWQRGALSRDSMLDLFRRGAILPEGRTNAEETKLIEAGVKDRGGMTNDESRMTKE